MADSDVELISDEQQTARVQWLRDWVHKRTGRRITHQTAIVAFREFEEIDAPFRERGFNEISMRNTIAAQLIATAQLIAPKLP